MANLAENLRTERCALTSASGKFVKSHLYPQSFYSDRETDEPYAILGTNVDERPKKSWTGLFDGELVTIEGETILQAIDSDAKNAMGPFEPIAKLSERASKVWLIDKKPWAVETSASDASKTLLFVCSVLWRFHASGRPECKNVTLGPYGTRFREATLNRDVSKLPELEVMVNKLPDDENVGVITPAYFKNDSVNMYELILGGFRIWAKVDKRPFDGAMQKLATRLNEPLRFMIHPYKGSKSYRNFVSAAQKQVEKYGLPWNTTIKQRYGI